MRALAAPLDLLTRMFRSGGKFNWRLAIAIFAIGVAQAGAVALISWLDHSWHLDGGRGFSQHYGAWAILATDPLLLIAAGFLDRQFLVTFMTLPLRPGRQAKQRMSDLRRKYVLFVRGRRLSVFFYILAAIAGTYFWVQNMVGTYDPQGPMHYRIFEDHDVFDSGAHIWSYIAFKACLFISWVIIWPAVAYKFVTAAIGTRVILQTIVREDILCPRVEHPDSCYGLRNVGNLNIAILAPYLLVFSAIVALWVTHKMVYPSLLFSSAAVLVAFLVSSFVVIWPVYSSLCRARADAFKELVDELPKSRSKSNTELYRFSAKRFFYSAATASPYSLGAQTLITAMRILPALGFALNFLRPSG